MEFLRENTFSVENMRELIEIYLNTTPLMYNELLTASENNNKDLMKRTAHKLKSNMNTMGVLEGSAILDKIEQNIEAGTSGDNKKNLQDLHRVIKLSEVELKKSLQEL